MEEKPQYLVDAEQLMQPSIEIHHQTTVIRRRGNKLQEEVVPAFVKITTDFKKEMAEIEPSALKVWLFLALSVNRTTEQAHPGIRTIASNCGMGENTVITAIRQLEARGLIEVNREDRKYNIYEFTDYVSVNTTASKNDTTASEKRQTASEKPQTASIGKGLTRGTREPDSTNENSKPLKGIEQAIFQDRPVTQEDINASSPKYKQLCERIEKLLKVTPNMANPKWETVLNGIDKREKLGQSLDNYARWCKEDKFNSPKTHQIAKDPHVILDTWVAAFADEPYRDPRMKEWHEDD